MSIKAIKNISHNGILYKHGETISEITKDEAIRLLKLNVAELIDNKFKQPKGKIKKQIATIKRVNRRREEEFIYAKS